jgi:hypothetical protein
MPGTAVLPICNTTPWRSMGNRGMTPRILISALDGGQLHAPTILSHRGKASSAQYDGTLGVTLNRSGYDDRERKMQYSIRDRTQHRHFGSTQAVLTWPLYKSRYIDLTHENKTTHRTTTNPSPYHNSTPEMKNIHPTSFFKETNF